MTAEFKEKRKLVDELKDELQSKIAEYSKMAESGKKRKPTNDVSRRRNARVIPDGI